MILAERAARRDVEALATQAPDGELPFGGADRAAPAGDREIEKLKRDIHCSRSERKAQLLEPMELQLEGNGEVSMSVQLVSAHPMCRKYCGTLYP